MELINYNMEKKIEVVEKEAFHAKNSCSNNNGKNENDSNGSN